MSTDTRVELARTVPSYVTRVGEPVAAGGVGPSWYDVGRLLNWVRGRGRQLVPGTWIRARLDALGGTSTDTFRFRTHPSGTAIARLWWVVVRAQTTGVPARFTLTAGSGATSTEYWALGLDSRALAPFVYLEDCSKSTSLTELTLEVECTSGGVIVESVGCWELPRAQLNADSTDLGIKLDSFFPRRAIYQDTYEGPHAIAQTLRSTVSRRIGHVSWWGDPDHYLRCSVGTWTECFVTGWPVVPRKDLVGDTTHDLSFDVYAAASNGTTEGEVRIKDAAGNTSSVLTITLGSTSYGWLGPDALSFKCEDLSTANGLRGGSYDTVQLEVRRTAGAGEIRIRGWDVWEET